MPSSKKPAAASGETNGRQRPPSKPKAAKKTARKKAAKREEPLFETPPLTWEGRPVERMPMEAAEALAAQIEKIYVLIDPRDGLERYVGFTVQPLHRRWNNHRSTARSGHRARVFEWIRELLAEGLEAQIERIDAATEAKGIAMFPWDQLLNERKAGGGNRPRVRWPPEWVAVLGAVPDRVLAEWRGLGTETVRRLRVDLGVLSYRARRRKSAA